MTFLPPNQEQLEDLTAQLLPKVFGCNEPATRYGRSGQKQHGIDVLFRMPDGTLAAAQCKAYNSTKLQPEKLQKDLCAAHGFLPALGRLIVVTSAPRDTALHDWALAAKLHGKPCVQIWFWEDVIDLLDQYKLLGNYINRLLTPAQLAQIVSAAGFSITTDVTTNTSRDDSSEVREFQRLLVNGRAAIVIERLAGPLGVKLASQRSSPIVDLNISEGRLQEHCHDHRTRHPRSKA